jgi:hypothetical protein
MTKLTPLAALLSVAIFAGGVFAAPKAVDGRQRAITTQALHIVCAAGAKRASIGGHVYCLRVGQRCDVSFNTTKPSYRGYGFLCSSWYGGAPATLFQIAQPGTAPATCIGLGPTPTSVHPGSQSTWVGDSPLWLGPYLDWRTSATSGIWRYRYPTGLRDRSGWGVKFLWQLLDSAGPTRVSFTDIATGQPLPLILAGNYVERSTAPLLDPARPGHQDPFGQHPGASEWGSTVLFPRAGCYRLDAQWAGGSATVVFSFGR